MRRPARTDPRVDLVLAAACGIAAFVCLILPSSARSGASAKLRTTLVAPLASMQVKAELSRRAFLAHDDALRVADSVALRSQRLTGVEAENDHLRKLLGLGAALKWGFIPAEALQGRGIGDDFTVTLSAGTASGVAAMSPVVTPEGIVGMVERADNSLSIAIFWPHPDFRVSAMAADGGAFGIITGHHGEGASRFFMELHSVPLRSPLKAGTLVVSSGLGGVYPRGIPIGVVVSELKTTEGFAKSYLVKPMATIGDISSVYILTPQRVHAGVENVWSTENPDSLRKAIAAAGDSLRKAAAAATAAQSDSLKGLTAAASKSPAAPATKAPAPAPAKVPAPGPAKVPAKPPAKPLP